MQSPAPQASTDTEMPRTLRHRLLTALLHVYFRLSRSMTFGVRAAVLNDRGEVFLVRHGYIPGWYLPGI